MHAKSTWLGTWVLALTAGLAPPVLADDSKPLPKELGWVPADSAGFAHVRFAELWSSSLGKNLAKLLNTLEPKALLQLEQQIGLPLSRIDRVTVVVGAFGDREPFDSCAIRFTTTRPYDRRDVLAALNTHLDKGQASGDRDLLMLPGRGMLHFSDDQTITFIPRTEGVYALLGGLLSRSKVGGLSPGLALAAEKNQLVASVDVTKLPRVPVDQIPPDFKPLRPLLDAKSATLIGSLAEDTANLELRLTFAAKEDASDGKQALEEAVKMVKGFLDETEKELSRSKNERKVELEILKEVNAALATVKVEHTDTTVRATGQIKVGQIMTRLLADGATLLKVSADRSKSQNNLKQMGIAFHNYNDTFGDLPLAAICDTNGKPLLSWRVAILPYIEQDNLYKQFKLDEPWDSEHNIKLIKRMPEIYRLPGDKIKHEYPSTYYQAFVGPGAAFEGNKKMRIPVSFPDGTSNTVWLAEAADPVPWTKPEDITYDPKKMPKIGFHFGDRCNVGFADGSVRAISKKVDAKIWHLLIQRDDGQPIPNFDD